MSSVRTTELTPLASPQGHEMGWGGVNPEHMCPDPHWPGQQGIQPVPPHIGPVISSADFLRAFLAPKPGSVPLPNHHHLPSLSRPWPSWLSRMAASWTHDHATKGPYMQGWTSLPLPPIFQQPSTQACTSEVAGNVSVHGAASQIWEAWCPARGILFSPLCTRLSLPTPMYGQHQGVPQGLAVRPEM